MSHRPEYRKEAVMERTSETPRRDHQWRRDHEWRRDNDWNRYTTRHPPTDWS